MNRKRKKLVIVIMSLVVILVAVGLTVDWKGILFNPTSRHSLSKGYNEIDRKIAKIYKNNYKEKYEYEVEEETEGKKREKAKKEFFELEGILYYCTYVYVDSAFIDTVIDTNESSDDVFIIKNISKEYGVAMKTESDENYYYYCSDEYKPKNVEDFLNDIGIYENIRNLEVSLTNVRKDDNRIVFFDEFESYFLEEIKNLGSGKYTEETKEVAFAGLTILYEIEPIKEKIFIDFFENGDIFVQSYKSARYIKFDTEEDGISFAVDLLDYLGENCKGYIY